MAKGVKSSGKNVPLRGGPDRADDPLFVPRVDDIEFAFEGATATRERYALLLESICGSADDSQAVEQYNGALGVTTGFVAAHQSAVCQVQWNANLTSIYTNPGNVSGVRWGTGTMVADDIMLTCGHLFDQTGGGWERPRQNGTTNIISPQEIARNMRVNFNFQIDAAGNMRPEQSFPIVELLEYRLGSIDMAVCRIGGNPGAIFGRTGISTTDASVPDMLCIIGHPAGQPKRVEAGPTTAIDGNLIRYNDIDTLGGNSGSGILRASDGRLVGIHTNGGCGPASPGPGGGSNFGQRIVAVIGVSPTLQRLTRPKLKFADDPVKLKFRDDNQKRKVFDDPIGSLKFRDDAPQKFKSIDDIKRPGLDKGFDGRPPLRRPGEALRRPFVLSTPHHAHDWSSGAQSTLAAVEEALMELSAAIAANDAEAAELQAQYQELEAEYAALTGGGKSPGQD